MIVTDQLIAEELEKGDPSSTQFLITNGVPPELSSYSYTQIQLRGAFPIVRPDTVADRVLLVNEIGFEPLERRLLAKTIPSLVNNGGSLTIVQRADQIISMPLILSQIYAPLDNVDFVTYTFLKSVQ